jgi:hypothetical protein
MKRAAQLILVVLWLIAAPVLLYHDAWPGAFGTVLVIIWLAALPLGWKFLPRRKAPIAASCLAIVLSLWMTNRPSNDREWIPEQARMVAADFDGDIVALRNLRHTVFDIEGNPNIRWYEKSYDLSMVSRMDFVLVPLSTWEGIAHTFVTFGFSDGEYLAISVESRREVDEEFAPVPGLFRKYELLYVMGDERDLIGKRLLIERCPVYILPIRASRDAIRELLVSMLTTADGLRDKPAHYNTLGRNCTTAIVRHMEDLQGKEQPFDLRILFPGYSAAFVYELGLIDVEGRKPDSWEQFRIQDDVSLELDGRTWSASVRSGQLSR